MITKTLGYRDSEGTVHASIEAAQQSELSKMFGCDMAVEQQWNPSTIAMVLVKHREKVIDILTTTPTSKPRARAINGAVRKKRTPRTDAQALPFTDATKPAA